VSEAAPVAPEPEGSRRFGRRAGWWAVGGGGAALVVGAVAGLQARSKLAQLKDGWADGGYPAFYDSKSGDVKAFSIIADTLFVGGLAAAGWGSWLLLRKEPESMPVAVAPVPLVGGGAIVATGSF
jgi:hypothetical protein